MSQRSTDKGIPGDVLSSGLTPPLYVCGPPTTYSRTQWANPPERKISLNTWSSNFPTARVLCFPPITLLSAANVPIVSWGYTSITASYPERQGQRLFHQCLRQWNDTTRIRRERSPLVPGFVGFILGLRSFPFSSFQDSYYFMSMFSVLKIRYSITANCKMGAREKNVSYLHYFLLLLSIIFLSH